MLYRICLDPWQELLTARTVSEDLISGDHGWVNWGVPVVLTLSGAFNHLLWLHRLLWR
jgi:hypothetical protein